MYASLTLALAKRRGEFKPVQILSMTTAETSATSFDPSFAEPRGWPFRRLVAPFAVAIALLSDFLTFVVLTGLTPVVPTHEVVITFLLINGATILLLLAIIAREVWQVVPDSFAIVGGE